jgi:thiol:disulfide interchange protein
MTHETRNTVLALGVGLVGGALLYQAALTLTGTTLVDKHELTSQRDLIESLQEENGQLSEDLFAKSAVSQIPSFDDSDLPYDESADAHADVNNAREAAARDKKFLMVTFGANWCVDCRTLHKHLKSEEVSAYTKDRFMFVNVDVGMFDHNTAVAAELGVTLRRGVPVAIFFDRDGRRIGATNNGELEPARYYTSNQILKFVRDVAERSRIMAPDSARQQ